MVTFQPIKTPPAACATARSFPQNALSAALFCEDALQTFNEHAAHMAYGRPSRRPNCCMVRKRAMHQSQSQRLATMPSVCAKMPRRMRLALEKSESGWVLIGVECAFYAYEPGESSYQFNSNEVALAQRNPMCPLSISAWCRLFVLGCRYSGQVLSYQKMTGQLRDVGSTTTLTHYLRLLAR
jgi:hypothetical protein